MKIAHRRIKIPQENGHSVHLGNADSCGLKGKSIFSWGELPAALRIPTRTRVPFRRAL
jgi:hypothetical protein